MASLAQTFGAIHRSVGVAKKVFPAVAAVATHRDPNAGGDEQFVSLQVEGRLELLLNSVRHCSHDRKVDHPVQQDRELVPPETCDGIAWANAGLEPLSDRNQQLVSHPVSVAVVDALEPVDVQKQHGVEVLVTARRPPDDVIEAVHEKGTVG